MNEQKRNDKKSTICLTPKSSQSFFLPYTKQRKHFYTKKSFFNVKGWGQNKKKGKEAFLTALTKSMKKDLTKSIGYYELGIHQKTVKTALKQDLSLDHHSLDYALWGILENKTNATSHPNIGSLKIAIGAWWNNMYGEFILKACESFQRRVDTLIKE